METPASTQSSETTPISDKLKEEKVETPAELEAPAPKTEGPATETTTESTEEEYEIEVAENSPLSQADLDRIAALAGRMKLSKEDAQELVKVEEDAYARGTATMTSRQIAEQNKAKESFAKDPDFSGDKASDSWDEVNRAVNAFGSPELRAALNTPGIGDNIHIARFLKGIGAKIKPENTPAGKGAPIGGDQKKSGLETFYPEFYPQK